MALYSFQNVQYKHVLNIPSLLLYAGGVTTLFGPSGSGKTTLLRLLNKLISPSDGEISFEGRPLEEEDSVALRRRVSMLSQTPVLFEGTVRDNLCAALRFQGRETPDEGALAETLRRVHLDINLDDSAAHLSGGEKQRLALGRILLLDAPVYLLDEPSSALDGPTARAVVAMMAEAVRGAGKTLVMVTHSEELARAHSSRIVHLEAGRVTREEEME